MWFDWIARQVAKKRTTEAVAVLCRTRDGREFAPFSIETPDGRLILCENDELDGDDSSAIAAMRLGSRPDWEKTELYGMPVNQMTDAEVRVALGWALSRVKSLEEQYRDV